MDSVYGFADATFRFRRGENVTRICTLSIIVDLLTEDSKNIEKNPDLFSLTKKYVFDIFIDPRHSLFTFHRIIVDRKTFYKHCQYRLFRDKDYGWGVVELEYGAFGKYFLLITEDRKVFKILDPILPEQKGAIYYPKKEDGEKFKEKEPRTYEMFKYPDNFSEVPTISIKELIKKGIATTDDLPVIIPPGDRGIYVIELKPDEINMDTNEIENKYKKKVDYQIGNIVYFKEE